MIDFTAPLSATAQVARAELIGDGFYERLMAEMKRRGAIPGEELDWDGMGVTWDQGTDADTIQISDGFDHFILRKPHDSVVVASSTSQHFTMFCLFAFV